MTAPPSATRRSFQRAARGAVDDLIARRFWRSTTFWLIAGFNILVLALYLWSRGGSTVDVRVEAVGDQFRAFADGELVAEATFDARGAGGIGFALPNPGSVPSLPGPSGIESVRVTDSLSGEVLFEDGFDSSMSPLWKQEIGEWEAAGGLLRATSQGVITTGDQPWENYVVEVELRNPTDFTVYVRVEDAGNNVLFTARPFRHFDTAFQHVEDNKAVAGEGGLRFNTDRGESIQSIAAMLLRPYPAVLLLALVFLAVAVLARHALLERYLVNAGETIASVAGPLVTAMVAGTFVLLWYLNFVVGERMPHVPDSVVYVWTAKMFSSFRITADAPEVSEAFNFFYPPFQLIIDGRWFGPYPFGHSLLLAIGDRLGAIWLVPPVIGALCVALVYGVGKQVYGKTVGLTAAVMLLFSPFFQMTASNFMSHSSTAFALLAGLFLYVHPARRRLAAMFFAGLFIGLSFNMRPLTAVTFMPLMGTLMAYEFIRAWPRRLELSREYAAFGAGGVLMLIAYFAYNKATVGSFTESGYALSGAVDPNIFGFGGTHSVVFGLQNQQTLLSLMLLVAHGWPLFIGLLLSAVPFLLGSKYRWDYMFGASALAIAATQMYFFDTGIMHGPRYWYESLPFFVLLAARGVVMLRDAAAGAGDWVARQAGWRPGAGSLGVTGFAAFSLVAALVVFSAYGWMLEKRDLWPAIDFVPRKISELEGFNQVDRRLLDRAGEMGLENALVLVEPCAPWWCYGSVFWANNLDLDGDIVWARRQGTDDDRALLELYAGRALYSADYNAGTIRTTTAGEILSQIEGPAAPDGEPGPPPDTGQSPEERDAVRRQHLDEIAAALQEYAARNGAFPDTGNQVQTLCVFRDLDSGCALEDVIEAIPQEPLGSSSGDGYWFLSDGRTFVVIAQQEATPEEEGRCPEQAGRPAGDRAHYCVQGQLEGAPADEAPAPSTRRPLL